MSSFLPFLPAAAVNKGDIAQELLTRRHARKSVLDFTMYVMPDYSANWHHQALCDKLDAFAQGKIQFLMVFMPPQHGKSQLVSRHLPAFLLGLNPKDRIACVSYAHDLASGFNRDVQRIIDGPAYRKLFPDTSLSQSNVRSDSQGSWLRNSDEFEVVGQGGSYLSVGIGGPLTGKPVKKLIIDDPVKNAVEAKSPAVQLRNWEWWNTTAKSRLHNDSQVIICQTRWDEQDLAGLLLAKLGEGKGFDWDIINFPAIKEEEHLGNPYDPRQVGEALWPERLSLPRLTEIKNSDPVTFNALYQQDPTPSKEAQIYANWQEIDEFPADIQDFLGLDFGFTNDPTAVPRVGVHNNKIYLDELIYLTGLTNPEIAALIEQKGFADRRIYADSAEPKSIKELKTKGLRVTEAEKGPDSIRAGIAKVKEYRVFVTKRSYNIWREYKYYQYHLNPDGTPSNEPRDAYNHLMDAIRYAVTMNAKKKEFILR